MGIEVWISRNYDTDEFYMRDDKPHYADVYGPIEVSNELYERIRECEREYDTIQGILQDMVYDWTYPEDD